MRIWLKRFHIQTHNLTTKRGPRLLRPFHESVGWISDVSDFDGQAAVVRWGAGAGRGAGEPERQRDLRAGAGGYLTMANSKNRRFVKSAEKFHYLFFGRKIQIIFLGGALTQIVPTDQKL